MLCTPRAHIGGLPEEAQLQVKEVLSVSPYVYVSVRIAHNLAFRLPEVTSAGTPLTYRLNKQVIAIPED